jgi:hypothetical protein
MTFDLSKRPTCKSDTSLTHEVNKQLSKPKVSWLMYLCTDQSLGDKLVVLSVIFLQGGFCFITSLHLRL